VSIAPSGEQFEFRHGGHTAVVTEVGATLRSYTADGVEMLDGFTAAEMCTAGRGQPLLPWPNRIAGGRYRFGDEELQLALTEPGKGNAIHGLARWTNWRCVSRHDDAVAMEQTLHAQSGYPFVLGLRIVYRLDDGGLTVATTARNLGDRAAPYGAGFHPYLRVGAERIDSLRLRAAVRTRLESDDRAIPTGARVPVSGGEYDFTTERAIGGARLDTAFTDLDRDAGGRFRVVLTDPSTGRGAELWMDESFGYLMLFTGDSLEPSRRRTGLGIEPMTCAPDAFNNGWGLVVLEPGEEHTCRWGITPR
jgi:aldose 1-epimerase